MALKTTVLPTTMTAHTMVCVERGLFRKRSRIEPQIVVSVLGNDDDDVAPSAGQLVPQKAENQSDVGCLCSTLLFAPVSPSTGSSRSKPSPNKRSISIVANALHQGWFLEPINATIAVLSCRAAFKCGVSFIGARVGMYGSAGSSYASANRCLSSDSEAFHHWSKSMVAYKTTPTILEPIHRFWQPGAPK
jgi:hypothetical protein